MLVYKFHIVEVESCFLINGSWCDYSRSTVPHHITRRVSCRCQWYDGRSRRL